MSDGLDFRMGIPNAAESGRFQRPMFDAAGDIVAVQHAFASQVVHEALATGGFPLVSSTWGYRSERIEPDQVADFAGELEQLLAKVGSDERIGNELRLLLALAARCAERGYAVLASGP